MFISLLDDANAGRAVRSPHAPRVLIYSHDTFGLGHIRRCRAIANALVAAYPHISVVIVSGSPVISSFQFGDGIDYVRIPGVEKQTDGSYTSHQLNMELPDIIRLRKDLIRQLVVSYDPDVVIVDKEPIGLGGELVPALEIVRRRGARIVLGVRDVLDEPGKLAHEWRQSGALDALATIYDDLFVYGLESIYRPLDGLPNQALFADKILYTGYLKRAVPTLVPPTNYPKITKGPFVLVTPGGGGDGTGLIDWVISAYESEPSIDLPALIVFGPFLPRDRRREFAERIGKHPKLAGIGFDPRLELLMNRAHCVVAMGGYNTFCEILSFDKPALIVPRARPRLEQTIRAMQGHKRKLIDILHDPVETGADERDPALMAAALKALPKRAPPSQAFVPNLLDGLPAITRALAPQLSHLVRHRAPTELLAAAK